VTLGLRALSAPVLDVDGHPVGAVSVVAPSLRGTLEQFVKQAAQPVRDAADQVGRLLQAGGGVARALTAAA
jgi:DNA-binding IclR family transcriptional regulator